MTLRVPIALAGASGGLALLWWWRRRADRVSVQGTNQESSAVPRSVPSATNAAQPETAPIASECAAEAFPPLLTILYDEGLAADLAEALVNSPTRPKGIELLPRPIAEFKKIEWSGGGRHAVAFIISTLENEQPSESAGACVRFFHRRAHPADMLSGGRLRFAVLGLGDSNLLLDRQTTTAKDCNQVAQRLDRRLEELGATRFCPRGEADERTDNTEIELWLRTFEAALARQVAPRSAADAAPPSCPCCNLANRPRIRLRPSR